MDGSLQCYTIAETTYAIMERIDTAAETMDAIYGSRRLHIAIGMHSKRHPLLLKAQHAFRTREPYFGSCLPTLVWSIRVNRILPDPRKPPPSDVPTNRNFAVLPAVVVLMLVALPAFNHAAAVAGRFGALALPPLLPLVYLAVAAGLAAATLAAQTLLPLSWQKEGSAAGLLLQKLLRRLREVTHAVSHGRFRGTDLERTLHALLVRVILCLRGGGDKGALLCILGEGGGVSNVRCIAGRMCSQFQGPFSASRTAKASEFA